MKVLKNVSFVSLNIIVFLAIVYCLIYIQANTVGLFVILTDNNLSVHIYQMFLVALIAPITEEFTKFLWRKTRGQLSAIKYALWFGIVESILFLFSFWSVLGAWLIPLRLMSIGMHVQSVRIMDRKGYVAAVTFHSAYNIVLYWTMAWGDMFVF